MIPAYRQKLVERLPQELQEWEHLMSLIPMYQHHLDDAQLKMLSARCSELWERLLDCLLELPVAKG